MRLFILAACVGETAIAGCGGDAGGSTPPTLPDFSLTVSPSSLSVIEGATSSPITVSVNAVNGFTGTTSITITGLPAGATTNPAFPLSINASSSQQFTVTVPASAAVGTGTVTLHGTSGTLAHDAQAITLNTTAAIVQTSQSGTILYLQISANGHVARIGLDTKWGGSVVEVSMDGTNFVNAHDTGREVQPALYDLNGGQGALGWDPVLGGDEHDHGSPIVSQSISANSLYTKATPLYWNPDAFGGGAMAPVPSDMTFEQTVSLAPGAPLAFQLHLKLTHHGTDYHYVTQQEFPAVYVNSAYRTLRYYGGNAPWTGEAATTAPVPATNMSVYAPEQSAALVDANDQGLTVFVPGSYPSWATRYFPQSGGSGPTGDATAYMRPFTEFSIGPGAVIEGDIYLIPGDAATARTAVYSLHRAVVPAAGLAAPFGVMDAPSAGATISGANYAVAGWAVGKASVSAVTIYVDGAPIGTAMLGLARPDVAAAFPAVAQVNCGWRYSLNTTTLANGVHTIQAHIVDASNNEELLLPVSVTVSN